MRTYPGLAGEIATCLSLVEQVQRYVEHFGAAGVRADGVKSGVKMDAVNTLTRELRAMQQCIPVREKVG